MAASLAIEPDISVSAPNAGARYRPDIDGLRALAVAPVVFYHARIWPFTGGYIGVDIFFVISGYLITSLLASDLNRGQFSILHFYERRVRRIFPALFFVLAFCFCVAAALYMPLDFKQFGYSAVSLTVFASNVVFWRTAGYFDTDSGLKPLLHTWSLSVEEQFYVVFPWLLALIFRFRKSVQSATIFGLAACSFASAVVLVRNHPVAAFYLPFSRAWELLLGAMLVGERIPAMPSRLMREMLGLAGLVMIAASVFDFSPTTPFPGLDALLPCGGAALIIYSGRDAMTITARLLSARPLVALGLISYSLYLWHWPLLVFARYFLMRQPSAVETVLLTAASVGIAAVSWRFVEQPFRRRGREGIATGTIFAIAGIATASVVAAGLAIYTTAGFPGRLPEDVRELAAGSTDTLVGLSPCDRLSGDDVLAGRACEIGDPSAPEATFALLGDSFGVAIKPGVDAAARTAQREGISLTRGACYPVLDAREYRLPDPGCERFNNAVSEFIEGDHAISTIVIAARWTSFAEGTSFKDTDMFMVDDKSTTASYEENKRVFDRSLRATLASLKGKNVFIVVGIPEHPVDVPLVAALSRYLGRPKEVDTVWTEYEKRQAFVKGEFAELSKNFPFHILDPSTLLCDGQRCRGLSDGKSLYSDSDHLSRFGAVSIAGLYAPVFAPK